MKLILSIEHVRFPLTGIGRYSYELARHLQARTDIDELRFFARRCFVDDIPVAAEASGNGHKLKRWVQQSYIATQAYRIAAGVLKARALNGYGDFLYHSPNFYLPRFSGRRVATFHDLSPFVRPQGLRPSRARFLQNELTATLERADALITDSNFTRLELAGHFSWPLEKIHVVPLASGSEFHPRAPNQLHRPLARYGLAAGGYTLFVGTIEPRKNIDMLLDAYGRLPLPLRQRTPLVLAGYRGWCSEKIHARIQAAQAQGWARYLGFTPAEDLPFLFAGARLFAFPSLYEGFGLPVLEAMSSGVPVVCSNNTSLPEVAGGAALMCDAQDVDLWTRLLHQGLLDDAWRTTAISCGLRHSTRFSWPRCAMETMAVYRAVSDS